MMDVFVFDHKFKSLQLLGVSIVLIATFSTVIIKQMIKARQEKFVPLGEIELANNTTI
jgi:drug/metabolite transporter (DMT)-like permease